MITPSPVTGVPRQAGRGSPIFNQFLPRVPCGWALLWLLLLGQAGSVPSALAQRFSIFPLTNVWRYNTNCLDASGWEQPTYNDLAWPGGPGGFTGGETLPALLPILNTRTLPSPAAASQIPAGHAMYFRTHFTVASVANLSLILSNAIDDGALFYLNGVRILSLRGPADGLCASFSTAGAIGAGTDALLWEVNTLDQTALAGILHAGDNVLAVSVHQTNNTSSDMVFGMEMLGEISFAPRFVDPTQPANTNVLQCRSVTLTCVPDGAPSPSLQWFKNGAPIPGATASTLTIPNAQASDAGQYFVQAVSPLGSANSRVATLTVTPDTQGPRIVSVTGSPQGTNVIVTFDEPITPSSVDMFSIFVDGAPVQGATASNPTTVELRPSSPLAPCVRHTVSVADVSDACAGNLISPNPTLVTFFTPLLLINFEATQNWRYEQSGTDLGIVWRDSAYDDSAWPSGPPLLALEGAGLPVPIRTPLTISNTKITFYFRAHFTLPTDPATVTRLQLRQVLDDGAVYYINGLEVFRSRIGVGAVNYATLAVNQPVDPAQFEGPFDLPLPALRGGDNVIAVEVHQSTAASTDVVFGAELLATVTNCIPSTAPRVRVDEIVPRQGREGDLITINGQGFHGGSPDDHCAVLVAGGNRFIDIEVLTATPTQLVGRIGVIPAQFLGPLQVMVGVGDGARQPICPAFADVHIDPQNWVWRGDSPDAAVSPQAFLALSPNPPPPNQPILMNFHSGAPANGMLMVLLDKDWGAGSRYCVSARVHAQGTGADTRIGPATFTVSGTRFDCARRLCDLLMKAFAAHSTRPLTVLCTVTTNGTAARITLTLPSGVSIDQGNIDILQKAPPPVIAGIWDFQNAGLWRKEVRKHEIARWYRCYEWRTIDTIWFERRAEGLWITRQALETFTCQGHCIYRFPNGRIWTIWRTYSRADLVRFWVHYRFWWPGRLNPLLPVNDTRANRTMMSMDDLQIVLPMTPADPNPSTPYNEAVMIVDENGQQHFQGQPGFEIPPDIAGNPNGFQIATTAESTAQLPPAADRIRDLPMQPMPGMANLQPGVIIQWLVDKNGNVLVDHDNDGWPDPISSPHVLGGQKHQGLIAQPTGVAGTVLPVDQGNNQLQLFCWELDPNGEVRGASPGQIVIGPPVDVNGDGVADGPMGGPVPADPTVRQLVVNGGQIQEQRDPTAKAFDLAVVEEAAPTDAQLAAMNQNLAAQIPGFVPLQRPFILCINRIWVRRLWTIDRRYVFDAWFHHWTWQHRNHIVLTHNACRVWLTKVSLSQFSYAQHCFPFGLPPTWRMFDLTQVRFFRVCLRVVSVGPNQVAFKVDQMYVTVPQDPNNPNSPLMLLSTRGDENALFQEVPPPVLAGLQPDPLPVGPDGVFVEPIDPVAGTLDIGIGGTGVFGNRPLEAHGMAPAGLLGNDDAPDEINNNQLQLYCWALNPNGTIAQETFSAGGFVPAAVQPITLAISPTPAIPSFVDEEGNRMNNPTVFTATLASGDNAVIIARQPNGGAQLSWEGPGQLQASDALVGNGPPTLWTDVPGGSLSPVTVNANQMKRFYRVRR